MSVKERTAAIRMILTGSDTENWHMLETYLTETTEKDRTAIARSLGGMYGLYEAEGPTLRMLYLWAALASNPEYLAGGGWADTLDYWGKQRRKTAYPVYTPAVMRTDKQALNRAVHAYETIRDNLCVCVEQTRMGVAGMPHARRAPHPGPVPAALFADGA